MDTRVGLHPFLPSHSSPVPKSLPSCASRGQPSTQWGNVPRLPAKLDVSASLPTAWPRWGVGPQ